MTTPKLDQCKHCGCDAVFEESFFSGFRVVCANSRCGISTPYYTTSVVAQIWNRKPTNTMEKPDD